eukprot:COSAG06_NODE_7685_length_2413_cov_1.905359_2_plen_472_part_01
MFARRQDQLIACEEDPDCASDSLVAQLSPLCLGCLIDNDIGSGPPPIEPCLSGGAGGTGGNNGPPDCIAAQLVPFMQDNDEEGMTAYICSEPSQLDSSTCDDAALAAIAQEVGNMCLAEGDGGEEFTATVAVGDGPFTAGAAMAVDFTGATDAADWIGLYLVGQTPGDDGSHDWSYHGSASDTGSLSVVPRAAGEYYVVMLCCDGYTEVSERVVITIGEASQCDGQANGAVCDDGNPASAVSLCHAGVCETTTFEQQPLSQCAAFIEPFDVALVTLELAEAACAANAACGGVSDLFCNGMFPGAVDHYALCDGAALVPDAATCVFQAPGSGLPPVVVDCVGAEDETPCDDGDDATPIDICHAGVCESTSYTKTSASQCAGFLEHDVTLVTLTLAQAACDAAPNCGGVSDLFCNGMFPGAVDHYALCDDSALVDDLSTCVYVDTADAGLVCMDLNADDYVGIDDLLLLLSAFG